MPKNINYIKSYRGVKSSIPNNTSAGLLNRMMVLKKEASLLNNQLDIINSKRAQLTTRLRELENEVNDLRRRLDLKETSQHNNNRDDDHTLNLDY